MGSSKTWFSLIRTKLSCSSPQTVTVLHAATSTSFALAAETKETQEAETQETQELEFIVPLTEQDIAAIKIQTFFRGHLARRAFRALKSLVKLQAVVRGVCVRRQARIALHCMHALTRLQVTVRARQLLGRYSDD